MERVMKDSGLTWIGDIPENWSISKIANVYSLRNTKISDREYPPLSVTNKGILPQLETVAKTNAHDDRKMVVPGDFVINSRSDRRGSCGVSPSFGSVSLINLVLQPKGKMHSGYYNMLFHTIQFADEFYKWGHGIVDDLWTTNWCDMRKISIPMPPYDEQELIATFLDVTTQKIDDAIEKAKALIDQYKAYKKSIISEAVTRGLDPTVEMCDSGIAWIGKIPSSWILVKGKFVLKYLQKPIKPGDDVITCFRDGEVTLRSNRREEGFTLADKECGYQGVDIGDLVVHGMDGFAGSIGISDSRGKASPVLNVLDSDQYKKYLMYYLRTLAYKNVFLALATGIRVRSCDLRWNKLANILILCPPLKEQQEIAVYLDRKCSLIDRLIEEKEALITRLQSYRKSVIYEYVTGKKQVPQ